MDYKTIIQFLLAKLFDALKVNKPSTLLWIALFATSVNAGIIFGVNNGLFGDNLFLQIFVEVLAVLVTLGVGMAGTRTTMPLRKLGKSIEQKAVHQSNFLKRSQDFFIQVPKGTQLGTEKLKDILSIFISTTLTVRSLVINFNWTEAINLVFSLPTIIGKLTFAKVAWEELKDLDKKEAEEVRDYLKVTFDLSDDQLEAVIEEGFDLIPKYQQFAVQLSSTLMLGTELYKDTKQVFDKFKETI